MPQYGDQIPKGKVTDYFEWSPDESNLGQGTYGTVCKAKCIKPRVEGMKAGETYAVKVVRKERLRTDWHWKSLLHEVEILQRIQSTYCICQYDAFQDDSNIYIVMEYVDGGELFKFIINRGHLSEQEALQITKQLLLALVFLHGEQKIVHRDLKPENVLMVKGTMQIKIIDFGFAKFFGQATSDPNQLVAQAQPLHSLSALSPGATVPSTPSDLILSTPIGSQKYCAPEVLKRLGALGVRARVTTRVDIQKLDIFAVGVITYAMLSGAFPFRSATNKGLAHEIERGIIFPEQRFQGVSQDAKDFCQLLLHPDRKKRPLAFDALNHRWLRTSAPTAPLEAWHSPSDPFDNTIFDEMRQKDDELEEGEETQEKVQSVPASKPTATHFVIPKKGANASPTRKSEGTGPAGSSAQGETQSPASSKPVDA